MNDGMDETQRLVFPSFSDAMGWVNGESSAVPEWEVAFGYPEEEEE